MAKKPQSDKSSLFRGRAAAEYIAPAGDGVATIPAPAVADQPEHSPDPKQVEPAPRRRSAYGPKR